MKSKKRILIVDDEADIRDLLKDIVEEMGHDAESAENGFEALAKLKLDIDLVLLDVMMPGMDGYEVARRIREDPKTREIPIIMVTALTNRSDRLRAVEAGVNDFIAKPADVFDALTSDRPYQKALSNEEAFRFLREGRGKHFDPRLVDLFIEHADEVGRIKADSIMHPPVPVQGAPC
jgi:response regulator RpfG family c-di-GMP phosphodiesterase